MKNGRPWPSNKDQRRKEAIERATAYNKLSPTQRMGKLDKYGHVALKERTKLMRVIDSDKVKKVKMIDETETKVNSYLNKE